MFPPERLICLTEETVETLYLLGQDHRIVGISGYVVRPPRARTEKPRVSSYISADMPKILQLQPDLVLAFSDLQADIVGPLIKSGIAVHAFNQRKVVEILDMIRLLGAMVGQSEAADLLARSYEARLAAMAESTRANLRRPRVYFEEWDEPMISAITWVSELIEIAGGVDIFREKSAGKTGVERIVTIEEVRAGAPDIIIGSWCGKKFNPAKLAARPGFEDLLAVKNRQLYEIKSPLILQPGPAALTDGLDALRTIIEGWQAAQSG